MAHRLAEKLPAKAPLRVLQRGTAMVQDYRALMETGTRRFHGAKFDPTLGPEDEFVDANGRKFTAHHGGFLKLVDQVVEISADDPHYGEYVKHLREGDFWAADKATADAAGVAFEAHFGDEHPVLAANAKAAAEYAAASVVAKTVPSAAPAAESK